MPGKEGYLSGKCQGNPSSRCGRHPEIQIASEKQTGADMHFGKFIEAVVHYPKLHS